MAGQHLYVIQSGMTGAIKIGRSDDPDKRLLQLQTGCPYPLKIILFMVDGGKHERRAHTAMSRHRTRQVHGGEWFEESGIGDIPIDIWENIQPWYQENPDWWSK